MAPDPVDWAQFPITVAFDQPKEVVGRLVSVRALKGGDGTPIPELTLKMRDGTTAVLVATQARLRSLLHERSPQLGQILVIRYLGPEPKAPPGMSPSKRFELEVREATK